MKHLASALGTTSMCVAGLFTILAIGFDTAGETLQKWSNDD